MTSCVEFICYLLKYYEYNFECKILMSFDVRGKLHCMYIKLLVISIITNDLDVHLKNVYVYCLYWCFNALCTS